MPSFSGRASLLCAAAAVLVAMPATAHATTTTIAGSLSVTAGGTSGLQAAHNGTRLFYSTSYSGFSLRFADGPSADRTFGASWGSNERWTNISEAPPVRDGATQRQETVYVARTGVTDLMRVQQTIRTVDDARTFRVTYRLENVSGQPLRYRAMAGGEVQAGGSDYGMGRAVTGPPRFVGLESESNGVRAGVEEVLESSLPGDGTPVAVPAWTARGTTGWWDLGNQMTSAAGPTGTVTTSNGDQGVGVSWEDHLGAALAPGATARYEVVWHVADLPRLDLTSNGGSRYVGAHSVTDAVLRDTAGAPVSGASLRWRVTGAHPATGSATTDADGKARIDYVGTTTGTDTVVVWADLDGDEVEDEDEPSRRRSVSWSTPPPQLGAELWSYDWIRVGRPVTYRVVTRDAIGELQGGVKVRWRVTGANPTDDERSITTDSYGVAYPVLTARHQGADTITFYIDRDDDATRDPDEPQIQRTLTWAAPPPPVALYTWSSSPRVGETQTGEVTLTDEFGMPANGGAVVWSVDGVNQRPPAIVRTNSSGRATFSYPGTTFGQDTIRAGWDRDDDGTLDADEPSVTRTVSWRQAPPPPETRQTLDADGLNVTVSSVGALQARFDDTPSLNAFDYSESRGFVLKILDGPHAGRTYGTDGYEYGSVEPFYGDPQPAPERQGATVVQRSSWRVRVNDVDLLRVRQTARVSDGATGFRLTWQVENLTDTPIRIRVGEHVDLTVGADWSGTPVTLESPAFIGLSSPDGTAAGVEAVAGSQLPGEATPTPVPAWSGRGIGDVYDMSWRLRSTDGLGMFAPPAGAADGVAFQWSDHEASGLAPGEADAARYEVVMRLRHPMPLRVTPAAHVAETRHQHQITSTVVGDDGQPRNGVRVRWRVTGEHPRSGAGMTSGLGQVNVAWTGWRAGRDTFTAFVDENDDGERDAGEPQRTAKVDWRAETAVEAPTFAPLVTPGGATITPNVQTGTGGTLAQLTPGQANAFPKCADGSPKVDMGMKLEVGTGAGAVVPGSMKVLTVSAGGSLSAPLYTTEPTGAPNGDVWSFVIECLPSASLYVCYELEEGDLPIEGFCVRIGGLGIYDPSGVVFDRARYTQFLSAGCTVEAARGASAIEGAQVLLQRKTGDEFRRVLSGDPYLSPNLNPFVTERDGRYGWHVSAGTYRVAVSRSGYADATSREVSVPPVVLDLHVGLDPVSPPPARTPQEQAADAAICATWSIINPLNEGGVQTDVPVSLPYPLPFTSQAPLPAKTTPFLILPSRGAAPSTRSGTVRAPIARRATGMVISKRGKLRLKLVCLPGSPTRCAGSLVAVAGDGRSVLATATYDMSPGARHMISMRLGTGRKQLLRRSRGKVVLVGQQEGTVFSVGAIKVPRKV